MKEKIEQRINELNKLLTQLNEQKQILRQELNGVEYQMKGTKIAISILLDVIEAEQEVREDLD
jgi:chromosome segregation ATPase